MLMIGNAAKSNSYVESVFYCEVTITCCSLAINHSTLHYSCCRTRCSTIVLGSCTSSRPSIFISRATSQQSSHGNGSQRSAAGVTQLHSPSDCLSPSHLSSDRSLIFSSLFFAPLFHSLLHSSLSSFLPFFPFPSFYLCSLHSSASFLFSFCL